MHGVHTVVSGTVVNERAMPTASQRRKRTTEPVRCGNARAGGH